MPVTLPPLSMRPKRSSGVETDVMERKGGPSRRWEVLSRFPRPIDLAKHERQEREAGPASNRSHLVQVRAGKDSRRARSGSIAVPSIFWKQQLAALVVAVEIYRQCEAAMSRGRTQVVAMGPKKTSLSGSISDDLEPFEACRPVRERFLQLGDDPTSESRCQQLQEVAVLDDVIASPLRICIDGIEAPAIARRLDASGGVSTSLPGSDEPFT